MLQPVIAEMKQHDAWGTFSDDFKTMLQLLGGGFCELQIAGEYWDFNEDARKINQMLKAKGTLRLFLRMIDACITGLRAAERPPSPSPPSRPPPAGAATPTQKRAPAT